MANIVVENVRNGILAIQEYLSNISSMSESDTTPSISIVDPKPDELLYGSNEWASSVNYTIDINGNFSNYTRIKVRFVCMHPNYSPAYDAVGSYSCDIGTSFPLICELNNIEICRIRLTIISDTKVNVVVEYLAQDVVFSVRSIYGISYNEGAIISPIQIRVSDVFVNSVSKGKYGTYAEAVRVYMRLLNIYAKVGSVPAFCRYECGVKLNNVDGGSVFGLDRGGSVEVPRQFIFPDTPIETAPSGSFTIEGLTFVCPEPEEDYQQYIYNALYTWWAKSALTLIKTYYGIYFGSTYSLISTITVEWDDTPFDPSLLSVAQVQSTMLIADGSVSSLKLIIPKWYKDYLVIGDSSGPLVLSEYDTILYTGKIIVHEFVHAVMHGNIRWSTYIPTVIDEGLAELFIGSDFHNIVNGKPAYTDEVRTYSYPTLYVDGFLYSSFSGHDYAPATNFILWLAQCSDSKYDERNPIIIKASPFLNKFIYWLIYNYKSSNDTDYVINKSIEYATRYHKKYAQTLVQFLNYYVDKYNSAEGNVDDKLYSIANIRFNNKDCGCYGGSDSLVDDIDIPREVRIYYESSYEFLLGREEILTYSNQYFAQYDKEIYKYGGLTFHLPTYTSSTINVYFKKRTISRLVRHIFKYALDVIKKLLLLDFQNTSYCNDLYIYFDDLLNPTKPMRYEVSFDSSGKVSGFYLYIYIYAYIPEDNSDNMPSKGMYTGNVILYILTLFVLLSKLRHAQLYYRNPLLIAVATLLTGYDEFGADDIRRNNSEGRIPSVMGGDVDG